MKKVMEVRDECMHIVVKKNDDKYNPYRVYLKGWHTQRLIAKCADLYSCICYMEWFIREGLETKTVAEIKEISKATGAL